MMNKKSSMMKRYQKSYESRDSGGGLRRGIMSYDDVVFFKPEEGRNRINIIPYTIKSKNHPLVRSGDCKVGEKDYIMDIFAHRSIGAGESSVICLKKTYGKPCPVCEQSETFRKQGKEDEAAALRPSRRVFYNVQDLKDGKLKIFETSHFLFEKELIDEARDGEEGFVNFADEDEGKEISFKAVKEKKGKIEYLAFKSFRFEDREDKLDEDLFEDAVSFDEVMNVPTYEQVQKMLYGEDEEDELPEDSEEETAKTDRGAKKEPEEEEDDDEEAVEKAPEKPKKSDGGCPYGHEFGKDCDAYNECDDCTCWDKCCKVS